MVITFISLFDPIIASLINYKGIVPVSRIFGYYLSSYFIIFCVLLVQIIELLQPLQLILVLDQLTVFCGEFFYLFLKLLFSFTSLLFF